MRLSFTADSMTAQNFTRQVNKKREQSVKESIRDSQRSNCLLSFLYMLCMLFGRFVQSAIKSCVSYRGPNQSQACHATLHFPWPHLPVMKLGWTPEPPSATQITKNYTEAKRGHGGVYGPAVNIYFVVGTYLCKKSNLETCQDPFHPPLCCRTGVLEK